MTDDFPNPMPANERAARDAVTAYLGGTGALEAAVAAIRVLADEPSDDAEEEVEAEPLLGIDAETLPPEQRERFAALQEALEE